jgi:hypothetical protein
MPLSSFFPKLDIIYEEDTEPCCPPPLITNTIECTIDISINRIMINYDISSNKIENIK